MVAQTTKVQQIELELKGTTGSERYQVLMRLADAATATGEYEKAADWADEAENVARKLKDHAWRANAYHKSGLAFLQGERQGVFKRTRSADRFESSFKLLVEHNSKDTKLILANLELLKANAVSKRNNADIALYDADITKYSNKTVAPALIPAQYEAKSVMPTATAAPNLSLTQQPQITAKDAKEQAKLKSISDEMKRQLAEQSAAIDLMTEEQTKAALALTQQQMLLDSFLFRSQLDSVQLINKDLVIQEAESSRNLSLIAAAALLMLLGGGAYSFYRTKKHSRALQIEQNRSEELLLNILPALVAKELKKQGYTDPKPHNEVAVLFADFIGFSKISEILSPQELVHALDICFKEFDNIVQQYPGIEKIKTIGDAYMAASGLADPEDDRFILDMVRVALDMQTWLEVWNAERSKQGAPRFDARIGIHVGPVVAGVVGSKKFAFDIWGDTVNVAARVEQASERGRVNLSGEVYERIKDEIPCLYRGKIEAKNKGFIDMYFVE
jgi:adenylate cyclase